MSDEGPDIGGFIDGRRKYSDSRANYWLLGFDATALVWAIAGAYVIAGLPGLDGESVFPNAPGWLHVAIGSYAGLRGIYILCRLLEVRARHRHRTDRKTLEDLTGIV